MKPLDRKSAPSEYILLAGTKTAAVLGQIGWRVRKKELPPEALIGLEQRLAGLAPRSPERRRIIGETAGLYDVSEPSLYRALAQRMRPKALRRSDRGTPRVIPQEKMESYSLAETKTAAVLGQYAQPKQHFEAPPITKLLEDKSKSERFQKQFVWLLITLLIALSCVAFYVLWTKLT